MKRLASIVLMLALAGCAAAPLEPAIQTQTVYVPTLVKCTPNIGPDPVYPDTDSALKAAQDLFGRVQLMVAGRLMRIQRDIEQRAALAACTGS